MASLVYIELAIVEKASIMAVEINHEIEMLTEFRMSW
jgi:hypothetical protein